MPIRPSPTTPTSSWLLKASHVEHHGLQVAHVEHRVPAADASPAALSARGAAEGLVRFPVVGRVVHDDVADAEVVDITKCALQTRRVDSCLQSEVRVVCNGQGLL